MVKQKFLQSDLAIQLKMRRNNLEQREMDVMTYTEKLHTLSIRGGVEDEDEKVARYMSGLRYTIQDEIRLNVPRTLGECFQLAVRTKEKLKRKNERHSNSSGGGGTMRGRGGRTSSDSQSNNDKDKSKDTILDQRGGHRGGRFGGGRGNVFTGRCFHCNEFGD